MTMIPAHDSPLAALTFNSSATKLATASERVRKSFTESDAEPKVLLESVDPSTQHLRVISDYWDYLLTFSHHQTIVFHRRAASMAISSKLRLLQVIVFTIG